MPTRTPANSGVLIHVSHTPRSIEEIDAKPPLTGTVLAVGGGVPWLREGETVAFDATKATFFVGRCGDSRNEFDCSEALIHQRDVLAVIVADKPTACCARDA